MASKDAPKEASSGLVLLDLPDETLQHIFSNLYVYQITTIMRLCRRVWNVLYDVPFWRQIMVSMIPMIHHTHTASFKKAVEFISYMNDMEVAKTPQTETVAPSVMKLSEAVQFINDPINASTSVSAAILACKIVACSTKHNFITHAYEEQRCALTVVGTEPDSCICAYDDIKKFVKDAVLDSRIKSKDAPYRVLTTRGSAACAHRGKVFDSMCVAVSRGEKSFVTNFFATREMIGSSKRVVTESLPGSARVVISSDGVAIGITTVFEEEMKGRLKVVKSPFCLATQNSLARKWFDTMWFMRPSLLYCGCSSMARVADDRGVGNDMEDVRPAINVASCEDTFDNCVNVERAVTDMLCKYLEKTIKRKAKRPVSYRVSSKDRADKAIAAVADVMEAMSRLP